MRHYRFYITPGERELRQELWIDDKNLVHQWRKVLRLGVGDELVLFDGLKHERLYKIFKKEINAYKLEHVTDLERRLPAQHVYLFWSLLKKDKNEWVLQKCTELGVRNFVPLINQRTERRDFDENRAQKIVIEAVEQSGRSDIPTIHEPVELKQALAIYAEKIELFIADVSTNNKLLEVVTNKPLGVLIGPEGGFTDEEIKIAYQHNCQPLSLGEFTLRAETASISAVSQLLRSAE